MPPVLSSYWSLVFCALLAYLVGLHVYRAYFSPLSKFPGPKLAAATPFYEAYFDVVKDGKFPWKLQDLHREYGPVVRINPREIHIQDPNFVDELYQRRLDKDPWFVQSFGVPLSSFGTCSHNLHRLRRSGLSRFFSRASIASRVGLIEEKVLKLCAILESTVKTGEVVSLDTGFTCLTLDIISRFCFGFSFDYLDVPGFDKSLKETLESAAGSGAIMRQVPILMKVVNMLPTSATMRLLPQIADLLRFQATILVKARKTMRSYIPVINESEADPAGASSTETIFEQILASKLPLEEKTEQRLCQEAQTLVAAGSETTSRVLLVSTVHLLREPQILSRIQEELQTVMPSRSSSPSFEQLEQLPFLTATIKESIRLAGSVITRLSRISPFDDPVRYKDWVIPPGTPVSITIYDVLMDGDIFKDPEKFNPWRWLHGEKLNTGLDKYFVAFSRGPRSCVGTTLAWAELYVTMAHVHRKLDMELYETGVEDIASAHDKFSCYPKADSKGVRVKVRGLRKD